ncbi:class I SAM-dependent methyltransferase [Desulfoluna spongiiphila]|uniref:Methyltransferase domain-containing protein n=1 Tax=Desulfoluna spongiiphila TaxID=419481 RepID=A0A1G5AS54_9BACT|nr:methyltransferase domain-containing protein [Desulfoluna spongiiphila]SCX80681.1 Methyltransferase domain-containing protein [Desulfoluna spongiiphila]
MKSSNLSALDPFGQALLAYWRGDTSAMLVHEYKTGRVASIPVSVFFRSPKEFYPTEKVLPWCRGRILVVGAGTGIHAVELQRQGYKVTALEINPQAVRILTERGVKDVRQCDFFGFTGGRYDTVLMLGHTIGICETLSRIPMLLETCASLLTRGGQLLLNSVDESLAPDATDRAGYPGELEFRLSHEGNVGSWMRWLHVDFHTLSEQARGCGWHTEKLVENHKAEFLARLHPMPNMASLERL